MGQKIHIRLLAGFLDNKAGSHLYNLQLIHHLLQRGYRVSVVCFKGNPIIKNKAEIWEITPPSYEKVPFVWRFASLLRYFYCKKKLGKLNLPHADIVIGTEHLFLLEHRRMFPNTPFLYLPHSLLATKEIESYNLTPISRYTTVFLYHRIQRWAVVEADYIVRFANWAGEMLIKCYGKFLNHKIVINPMPVDSQPPPAPRPPSSCLRLLFIGRIVESKNLHLVLRTLASFRKMAWKLEVLGDGPRLQEMIELSKSLGIGDRVNFRGFQQDPSYWYKRSDLLVFPSRLESLGKVVLEAMSFGVPSLVIGADGQKYLNPFRELIKDQVTGFIASSEEDFSKKLSYILQNPNVLLPMRQAAYNYVMKKHTWSSHLDNYDLVFKRLMAKYSV